MMSLQEVAQILQAKQIGGNPVFSGVSTDSRTLRSGELFVALAGDRFEGAHFIAAAIERGAVAAVVPAGEAIDLKTERSDFGWILVKDTRLALGQLAASWRQRFALPLIAVTGSNGKTTVKEMLASIFRRAVGAERFMATTGNLNNDVGVPKMLLQLGPDHAYAVIEMGMNHPSEISYLSKLAAPTVAVITNAGSAHIEFLGSIEAIARAKGEIIDGLSAAGIVVINADDPYAKLWRQLAGKRRIIDFGLSEAAEVNARPMEDQSGNKWVFQWPGESIEITLRVPGQHNVYNALAATAAAVATGISTASIVAGLYGFTGMPGRLQKKDGLNHATLIDDTYNASPDSVRVALAVLAQMSGRKILIIGDMGELGADASAFHDAIGQQARTAGVEKLLALGEQSAHAVTAFGAGAKHFTDMRALLAQAEHDLDETTVVLVKGSRFMQMERVVEQLQM